MSFHPYAKYKILIDPESKKTQGLRVGDIVRRQYFDNPNLIYTLMVVIETGVDVIAGEDSPYFVGAMLEGDEPKNGQILDFVRITSLTDEDRGGALYLTASDSEAPYMDVIDGLAREHSLLYPVTLGELSNNPNKSHYTCMGAAFLDSSYSYSDRDTSRVVRLTRTSGGNADAAIGLKQVMESVPEAPARLLLSFKIRAAKESQATVTFGYADGTETEGSENIHISTEWEYCLFLINIDFPIHYSRALTIALNDALREEGEWCEIAELNLVALSSVANFNLGTKARIGKITGIIDPVFGTLDGYGAYFQHIYATKNVNIAGTLTAGDENGFASTFYVGKIHKNVIINSIDCETEGATALYDKSPTGIGNIIQVYTGSKLLLQSAEWISGHHNQPYCFSFWAKSDNRMDARISQNGKFIDALPIDSPDWKRYSIAFRLHGNSNEKLHISFDCGSDFFFLSSPQLEAGSRPSQYQPTDGKLSYVEDYGAWFNKGGIGGTIQNPLLRLNEDGSISSRDNSFVINPDGTGHFADGRFSWTKDTIILQDVTVRWEDLTDEAKENLQSRLVEITGTSFFHYPDELDTAVCEPAEIVLIATEKNFTSSSRFWTYLDSQGNWKTLASKYEDTLIISPDGHYWEGRNVLTVKYTARYNLTDYENQYTVSKLFDGKSTYSIYIGSTNGNMFKNGIGDTTLSASVFRGGENITARIPEHNFKWTRTSNDPQEDALWNSRQHTGKSITVTGDDVFRKAVFDCEVIISTN